MRSTDWIISVIFTLFAYLFFVNFESFRLIGLVVFSFAFAYYISTDEWRLGRAVLLTILPIVLAVVLLFVAPLLWLTIVEHSARGPLVTSAAFGFLFMLVLSVIIGLPLACAGVLVRHYRVVRVAD